MRYGLILGALALGACAVGSEMVTPSGARGYSLHCTSDAKCYEEAGKRCPTGYDVVTHNSAEGSMVVACKGP